jgi:hypothetical protein
MGTGRRTAEEASAFIRGTTGWFDKIHVKIATSNFGSWVVAATLEGLGHLLDTPLTLG